MEIDEIIYRLDKLREYYKFRYDEDHGIQWISNIETIDAAIKQLKNSVAFEKLTAMKAVLYLAKDNPRLQHGGVFIENPDDYERSPKIAFADAVRLIDNLLNGTYTEENDE